MKGEIALSSGQPKKLPQVPLPDHRYDTLDEWKRARGIDPGTRVFQVHGAFPSIRKALIERSWVENEDQNSSFWDFKYAMRKKDLNIDLADSRQDYRTVNYFLRNQEYTTKIRLCRNLENLVFLEDGDADSIVPRTYDLSSSGEVEAFIENFKANHCASLLMGHVHRKGEKSFPENCVTMARDVLQKKMTSVDELIEEKAGTDSLKIGDHEWSVLERVNLEHPTEALAAYRRSSTTAPKKKRRKKRKAELAVGEQEEDDANSERQSAEECLARWRQLDPQASLKGEHNLWIMKPASSSRGRGIFITNRLEEALDCFRGQEAMWMAQKYIEKPLLVEGKKFDIRQWVLVTSWHPLGVWFYEDAYLRFSFDDFDVSDQRNRFAHLTNYSVCKHAKNFEERRDETMMHSKDFAEILRTEKGADLWKEKIRPAMKSAAYSALLSCQDAVCQGSCRDNTFEFLGFDFMVDTAFNVWLLEINSSPDLSYSTSTTRQLVQQVLPDVIKVVIDAEKLGQRTGKRPTWTKKYLSSVDTGGWELLQAQRRKKEAHAIANALPVEQVQAHLQLVGARAQIFRLNVKRRLVPRCANVPIRRDRALSRAKPTAASDDASSKSGSDADALATASPSASIVSPAERKSASKPAQEIAPAAWRTEGEPKRRNRAPRTAPAVVLTRLAQKAAMAIPRTTSWSTMAPSSRDEESDRRKNESEEGEMAMVPEGGSRRLDENNNDGEMAWAPECVGERTIDDDDHSDNNSDNGEYDNDDNAEVNNCVSEQLEAPIGQLLSPMPRMPSGGAEGRERSTRLQSALLAQSRKEEGETKRYSTIIERKRPKSILERRTLTLKTHTLEL